MSQQLSLTIDGNDIPQDEDGLYSINDIFNASDSDLDKHSPKRWVRLQRTQKLISELESEHDLSTVKRLINSDKKAGTFVCTELVYSYAMHISPKFELKVIRGFHAAAAKEHRLARLHGKAEWHRKREFGIYERNDLTASIQRFIDYAKANGSRGAHFYFINITKEINKTLGISDRDEVTEDMLSILAFTEIVVESVITEGIRELTPYKEIYLDLKERLSTISELLPEAVEAYAAERKTPAPEGSRGILNIANNGGSQ